MRLWSLRSRHLDPQGLVALWREALLAPARSLNLNPARRIAAAAAFTGGADLACYSPAKAKDLDRSIRSNGTMHGGISPQWSTTVVCGFVDNTNAVCWQYSPAARAFVKVGEWIT